MREQRAGGKSQKTNTSKNLFHKTSPMGTALKLCVNSGRPPRIHPCNEDKDGLFKSRTELCYWIFLLVSTNIAAAPVIGAGGKHRSFSRNARNLTTKKLFVKGGAVGAGNNGLRR
jgi:hypothetical protein